jgi:hypothetical protein
MFPVERLKFLDRFVREHWQSIIRPRLDRKEPVSAETGQLDFLFNLW